jgi:hypothetical protein
LIVAEKSATFKNVATKDSHLDCRAPLILIVALHPRFFPPKRTNKKFPEESFAKFLLANPCQ